MLFDNLKLFRDIAQNKSISRGATMNEISQSAASQYIQETERRLGVTLLDRTTRPLALTPAGKLFYDLCRDALRREEQFQVQLENLKGLAEGAVRVASIYSVGLSEMSRLQEEFAVRFPNAQLHVDYLRPDKVYESVLTDQADLGLVSYPVGTKDLAVIAWREEEMAVAVPPSHLAGPSSGLRAESLADAESGEDPVQNVVGRGGAGDGIDGRERRVKIQQQHLVRGAFRQRSPGFREVSE